MEIAPPGASPQAPNFKLLGSKIEAQHLMEEVRQVLGGSFRIGRHVQNRRIRCKCAA